MIQKWTKSLAALALALLFSPLVTAEAHDRRSRHRHRDDGSIVFVNGGNTNNNGVRRRVRVRRGRNMTPGVRRGRVVVGRLDRDGIIRGDRTNRGRGHGRGHGKH